jgi:hypothetical protein
MSRFAALSFVLAACHAPARVAPVPPRQAAVTVVAPSVAPTRAAVHRGDPAMPPPPLAETISTGHDECALRQTGPIEDFPAPGTRRLLIVARPCTPRGKLAF